MEQQTKHLIDVMVSTSTGERFASVPDLISYLQAQKKSFGGSLPKVDEFIDSLIVSLATMK